MLNKLKRIFLNESLIVAAVILAAVFFAKFPTLYHWLSTPAGYWYPKQSSWYDAWDTNFQVSYMRYGQNHSVMLQNTYTTVPHSGVFIYQYYTFLGILNRFLKLDPFILYHLAGIVTSVVLILICHRITSAFIKEKIERIAAFIMIVLGGGLGWIFHNYISADINLAGFTMVNAFERGHDALSTIFILLTLFSQYKFLDTRKKKYIFYAILTGFFSITLHPPLAALYVLIGLIFAVWEYGKSKTFKSLFISVGIIAVFALYFLSVLEKLLASPAFSSQVAQSLSNVDSLSIILGLGMLSVFAVYALINNSQDDTKTPVLQIFILAHIFLLFSPLGYHLYFAKGLHVWLVIFSILTINKLFQNKKIRAVTVAVVVIFSLFTRIYIFNELMKIRVNNPWVFLTSYEGQAINFMSTLPNDKAVLSLYTMGNYIPAHTDLKVYYGHTYQTPDSDRALKMTQIFYTIANEQEQRKFLKDNHIDYVYYGLEETRLRINNKLKSQNPFPYFPVLYSNEAVIVYEVDKSISK